MTMLDEVLYICIHCQIEHDFSIEDRKWLFKSRLEDIDIPKKWNNENILCKHCLNTEMTQKNIYLNANFS